jgi:hypothetical protein
MLIYRGGHLAILVFTALIEVAPSQTSSSTPPTKQLSTRAPIPTSDVSDTVSMKLPDTTGQTSRPKEEWELVTPSAEVNTSSETKTSPGRLPGGWHRDETAGSQDMISSVASEIANVREQIRLAEAEDARFTGGLVKAQIGARIATLRQTEAMLLQRSSEIRLGVGPKHVISPADATQLQGLEQELADNAERIRRQEAETARYSGGLVLALSYSTLATLHQTQAILDQRRLALKFGLNRPAKN